MKVNWKSVINFVITVLTAVLSSFCMQSCKRPKMSQRPYLRAFCKVRKSHFLISFTKNFINPSRLSLEAGSRSPFYQISLP